MNKKNLKHGFTIVEILIVAPIVILVIGAFISVIVSMTGDVLSTRGSNALAFNIQDALNLIEQDVTSSGSFLATNNISITSPQGYNNDTTYFHNVDVTNDTMLILNSYATTTNPLTSTRSSVYETNPNACNSARVDQNQPIMINIVYFVKNNTLWRRVIMPSNYATVGCNTPWQQPSCAPGFTTPSFCKTQDTRLVDGIQTNGFVVNYYTSPSSITPVNNSDPSDSVRQTALQTTNTVSVTINATNTVAGRDISQSGTIRSVSPNNDISSVATVNLLVVAGGGGGGSSAASGGGGGGGGGGGLIYNASYVVTAKAYPVVIGGGGNPGGTSANQPGVKGGDSTFDSTTATGGGYGAPQGWNGGNGGSGGGGGYNGYATVCSGGSGVLNQGNYGGSTTLLSWAGGAGGGGAGGTGGDNKINHGGGDRGAGLTYSISGNPVTYSIGGAGGANSPVASPANTGKGGDAAYSTGTAYAGGSGIVIISYPVGSLITATGGTITTSADGNNKIHTFISNGTFTVL